MSSALSSDTLARARAALSRSKFQDLRRLAVTQDQDRIVIRGRVSSYYHKQLAQELIRGELGDVSVANEMQVAWMDSDNPLAEFEIFGQTESYPPDRPFGWSPIRVQGIAR